MAAKPIWERINFEALLTQFVGWLPSLFAAALLVLFFWLLYRITRPAVHALLIRTGFEPALANLLVNVYRFVVLAFGLVMAASQLGINVGAALAGLGVAGLTIGFAAKDSLSNVMAGFLIFWDKPFHVGDWVTLNEHYGTIAEITMRTTRLQTRDNKWVIIPNEKVINEILVNHSTHGRTRLRIPVGISYGSDIARARDAIIRGLKHVPEVLSEPPVQVVVDELAPSSVNLVVFAWIDNAADEKPVFYAALEHVKTTLDAAGVPIPFNQLEVNITGVEKTIWDRAEHLGHQIEAVRHAGDGH